MWMLKPSRSSAAAGISSCGPVFGFSHMEHAGGEGAGSMRLVSLSSARSKEGHGRGVVDGLRVPTTFAVDTAGVGN